MSRKTPPSQLRKIILEQARLANVGHIGSALSVVDLIETLYFDILQIPDPSALERDRFVLSKGHAALALYAVLYLKGWITKDVLNSYCQDGTLLGVHPERLTPGVDFGTGSLGMGMSYAVGASLAAKMQQSTRRVFVLVSDAECNEGVVWEAAMFAAHHRLSRLFVIVDVNGQQALGYTKEVVDTSPLKKKWEAFGWHAEEVNGHSSDEILKAVHSCEVQASRPNVILAQTTFGKGVSFMENKIKWHYWPMSAEEYQQALIELEPGGEE